MGEAYFYRLTRSPLEEALPSLLEKALKAGWRVTVRGKSPERMAWLDDKLWLGPDDSFLPHGLEGGPHDANQPVLLTTGEGGANAAVCLMTIDGAEASPDEVRSLKRVCILFDGEDEASEQVARGQWRGLVDAGCKALFWNQESGGWKKKAES